jgi:ureidoacrylate peracid hydrolase
MSLMQHPSGIHERIVAKVVARRGRLHAFETIDPARTAFVVIDLDEATVGNDDACQTMVANVNAIADTLRGRGGVVAWVLSEMSAINDNFAAILGIEVATRHFKAMQQDGPGTRLWPALDARSSDLRAMKTGASAFFPGKCNLKEQLDARGIDTLLIAGAVTNICCESSARDATELGYRVTMVSDALSGHAFGLHEATLATFYRIFGDVRPSDDVIGLLRGSSG